MAFLYPWGNTQQLNLDWIIQKIKELESAPPGSAEVTAIANALLAATYSASTTYDVGDIVYRNGKLYVCNTAIAAPGETWDASHWDEALLGDVVANLLQKTDGDIVQDVRYYNQKIQQKKAGSYTDVIPVEDTPSNNSDRLVSSKAAYDLKVAITSGTLLNGMPQTAMRIPANSDLNIYTTAGTYYVNSDADALTISNMPRSASGTLFVVNRAVENYKTQYYFPTSSVIINFVRNYNNGTWTDWQTNRNANANLATLEEEATSSHAYAVGDLLVWLGLLYRVISQISVGDTFTSGTNITPATLSTIDESGSGYCRMVDGTLMQWGTGSVPSGVYVQTDYTTFAKPFKDTNYITIISPDDDINIPNPNTANKTTTGFKCGRTPNTATNNYTWYAIGRWK